MSKYSAVVLALGLGLGTQAHTAELSFDLTGLGVGLLTNVALDGSFVFNTITQDISAVNIITADASYGDASGVLAPTDTAAQTIFSFSARFSTLIMDIDGFDPTMPAIDAGESRSYTASATQGTPSFDEDFELDGFPTDMFGGSILVTNTSQVSTPGVTPPATGTLGGQPAPGGRPATPAVVPLPASLPLALMGILALGWLSRRQK